MSYQLEGICMTNIVFFADTQIELHEALKLNSLDSFVKHEFSQIFCNVENSPTQGTKT